LFNRKKQRYRYKINVFRTVLACVFILSKQGGVWLLIRDKKNRGNDIKNYLEEKTEIKI
jgi:hypothetical protein